MDCVRQRLVATSLVMKYGHLGEGVEDFEVLLLSLNILLLLIVIDFTLLQ